MQRQNLSGLPTEPGPPLAWRVRKRHPSDRRCFKATGENRARGAVESERGSRRSTGALHLETPRPSTSSASFCCPACREGLGRLFPVPALPAGPRSCATGASFILTIASVSLEYAMIAIVNQREPGRPAQLFTCAIERMDK